MEDMDGMLQKELARFTAIQAKHMDTETGEPKPDGQNTQQGSKDQQQSKNMIGERLWKNSQKLCYSRISLLSLMLK